MRCWAARRERRGARSNSSRAGNGTACGASCRRACGNKGTSCACSCAPASACTGSKAELLPQGAEALLLPLPVLQARHRTKMAFEQTVKALAGGRQEERCVRAVRTNSSSALPTRELQELTGWQRHSVRGFLSASLRKRGRKLRSFDRVGERVYRLKN